MTSTAKARSDARPDGTLDAMRIERGPVVGADKRKDRVRLLPGLRRDNVVRELLAGVTLIAISVPLNIGYAQIAGLPATAGLYALVVPALVFALTASSRQLVIAPDAAAAALVASSLGGLAVAGSGDYLAMAAAQALISGALLLLASRLRLGFLADFLSHPILVGFVGGLALDIMVSQLAKMLGVRIDSGAEFLEKTAELLGSLGTANPWAIGLSLVGLAVLIGGRRGAPAVPWALLVMVTATVASVWWDFEERGIAVLGEVPAGAPAFGVPLLSLSQWIALLPSALALSAVVVAEGLMVARSYAEQHDHPYDADRDLAAAGLANLASGFSSSFSVGSSTSRTAAMDAAGSRTQLPSVVLAVGALLLLAFGTQLLEPVPSPVIGAIVTAAVWKLVGVSELTELWRESRAEFAVAATCFVGVLVLGPIRGLLVAFVFSLVHLARRVAVPPLVVLADPGEPERSVLAGGPAVRQTVPGVVIARVVAPVFFANANAITRRLQQVVAEAPDPVHSVVLDLEGVTDIDVTGAGRLRATLAALREADIRTAVARTRPELRLRLSELGLLDSLAEFATNRAALAALREPPSAATGAPAPARPVPDGLTPKG